MKEREFRKLVREELQNVISEMPVEQAKESVISQIYQWIIRGEMKKAMHAMQNDPELLRLAKNVEELKKELLKRMATDEATLQLIVNAINRLKKDKNIQ